MSIAAGVTSVSEITTHRWAGATAFAFGAVAVGVILASPTATLLGTIGVAYAAYGQLSTPPAPELTIERYVDANDPDPEDEVEVEVELTNDSEGTLPDVRVIDGVPDQLEVVQGSPRVGTALTSGESITLTYTVEAVRGRHEWDPAQVIVRNWSGGGERELHVQEVEPVDADEIDDEQVESDPAEEVTPDGGTKVAGGDDVVFAERPSELTCVPTIRSLESRFPLRQQTIEHAGDVTTSTGGSGLEFHVIREYQHGDPMNRIDWNHRAKFGEFRTVDFREERAATVALVVDTRVAAYLDDAEGYSAIEHAVDAAGSVGMTLMENGMKVGVATFGPEWDWLPPGMGRDQRAQLRDMLALGSGLSPEPSTGSFDPTAIIRRLRRYLPGDAQVVFFSPATDDYLMTAARRFEAYGHAVTLVTPDVTDPGTPGGQLAEMERERRLRQIRRADIPVIDWDPDEPLEVAIDRAQRRWLQ
ncbi:MAG: DUF58 domain-containing protein [Halobacteriaceae archaeon]